MLVRLLMLVSMIISLKLSECIYIILFRFGVVVLLISFDYEFTKLLRSPEDVTTNWRQIMGVRIEA